MSLDAPITVLFVVAKGKTVVGRSALEVAASAAPIEPPDEPDVTFTVTPDDAAALRSGALDLSVGFMRGQVKMAGDFGALLRALPTLSGPLQIA